MPILLVALFGVMTIFGVHDVTLSVEARRARKAEADRVRCEEELHLSALYRDIRNQVERENIGGLSK